MAFISRQFTHTHLFNIANNYSVHQANQLQTNQKQANHTDGIAQHLMAWHKLHKARILQHISVSLCFEAILKLPRVNRLLHREQD